MICYKDKCYCYQSSKNFCDKYDRTPCNHTECYRHSAEIPDELPEYLPVCWSTFYDCPNAVVKDPEEYL